MLKMRIVEPKSESPELTTGKKSKKKLGIVLLLLLVVAGVATFVFMGRETTPSPTETTQEVTKPSLAAQQTSTETVPITGELRIFTDNEFNVFYNNLLQPGLERVENPPFITGNDIADVRIREIAEARGYRLRASPSEDANIILVDGYQLHAAVADPWESLQSAAAAEGHTMSIVSAYRSVSDQRGLFTARLAAAGATISQVEAGEADDIVDQVLVESSIPGYSKHHTAYTIDLLCEGYIFENFKNSNCNEWLIEDNYRNAKEYGFIPSYPPEADAQGPDPEAWEYVYVGREQLTQ